MRKLGAIVALIRAALMRVLKFLRISKSMGTAIPILAPRVTGHDVLSKADYFVEVHLWPLKKEMHAEQWLENFLPDEKEHAIHLLNGFMYFSPEFLDQLFISAFQSLSCKFYTPGESFLAFQSRWSSFADNVIITYVEGEVPSPTDSGYGFARRARKRLGISEDRIMSPENAVRSLLLRPGPLVFVDDFVGSGEQFIKTWQRLVDISGSTASFERIAAARGTNFYYCPLICTEYGRDRLQAECATVTICPAHLLSPRYGALHADSFVWPAHLRSTAASFLENASARAGIPNTHGADDWRGFHELGLTIALGDSIPDATLPIFYWEKNGWHPLLRRT